MTRKIHITGCTIFGKGVTPYDVVIDQGVVAEITPHSINIDAGHVINGHGLWLAPAFIDNHVHLTATGMALAQPEIFRMDSAASLKNYVLKNFSSANKIFIGHGYQEDSWPDTPTILDVEIPAYISRIDAHSALVSQALIEMVPDVRTFEGFHESGRLTATAHAMVREYVLQSMTISQAQEFALAALRFAASQGIVKVHEMSGPAIAGYDNAKMISELDTSKLPSVALWWGELNAFERAKQLNAYGCGGDLFVDGSFGSKTALINESYADGARGVEYLGVSEIVQHIRGSIDSSMPTSFHAIGDKALDNIAKALHEFSPEEIRTIDFRIEHSEFISDDSMRTFAQFGIALSVQPQFDAYWGSTMYPERLGEKSALLNPFSKIVREGIPLLFGSDSPVTELNPWNSIRAAQNMTNSEHSISSRVAFRAHTTSGWRQVGDSRSHEINVGSPADVALWQVEGFEEVTSDDTVSRWSTNPRSGLPILPDLSAGNPVCKATIKAGVVIYEDSQ